MRRVWPSLARLNFHAINILILKSLKSSFYMMAFILFRMSTICRHIIWQTSIFFTSIDYFLMNKIKFEEKTAEQRVAHNRHLFAFLEFYIWRCCIGAKPEVSTVDCYLVVLNVLRQMRNAVQHRPVLARWTFFLRTLTSTTRKVEKNA